LFPENESNASAVKCRAAPSWHAHPRQVAQFWIEVGPAITGGKSGPSFCKPAGPGAAQTSRRSRPPGGGSPARSHQHSPSRPANGTDAGARLPCALVRCTRASSALQVKVDGEDGCLPKRPISRRNGRERVCHQLSTAQTRAVTLLQSRLFACLGWCAIPQTLRKLPSPSSTALPHQGSWLLTVESRSLLQALPSRMARTFWVSASIEKGLYRVPVMATLGRLNEAAGAAVKRRSQ
jgi:hypothetical protein